ncbi:MAG: dTDP-glucose 4,6-dehydratase [Bradymonadia bacterium]
MTRVLVTGGCGFIGTNLIRLIHAERPNWTVLNVDCLTYAGNAENLNELRSSGRYTFESIDITDQAEVLRVFEEFKPDRVFHLAAESHVDRSIDSPTHFVMSNVMGTCHLLEAARATWIDQTHKCFIHVSTDEVYGSLGASGQSTENCRYHPSSPYAASKASSDHLVRAYHRTYGLPVILSHSVNNFGAYQFPEKLIPMTIYRAINNQKVPVYGNGQQVRDWLAVEDHCHALLALERRGKIGQTYNVGGGAERRNLEVIAQIFRALAEQTGQSMSYLNGLIEHVVDRPGHDVRYALDATKLTTEIGWAPKYMFEEGIKRTVTWYLANQVWVEQMMSRAHEMGPYAKEAR